MWQRLLTSTKRCLASKCKITVNRHRGQATMRMASGQTLILTPAAFSPKGLTIGRKVPGPHSAFYVPATNGISALEHLDALGIAHGDRGAAKERHEGRGGT